jgi:glutathione S-transferase
MLAAMKLYGSTTSPFVRRVRIVLAEIGVPTSLTIVNTKETEGILRAVTPLWKMPVAEVDGQTIFDSRVIIDYLLARHAHPTIATHGGEPTVRESNVRSVIDGALEAAIFVFYLRRDGADVDRMPYALKQVERVHSALAWVEAQLDETARLGGTGDAIALPELALATALDWMDFRATYETSQHPRLQPFRARFAARPSFAATAPA